MILSMACFAGAGRQASIRLPRLKHLSARRLLWEPLVEHAEKLAFHESAVDHMQEDYVEAVEAPMSTLRVTPDAALNFDCQEPPSAWTIRATTSILGIVRPLSILAIAD